MKRMNTSPQPLVLLDVDGVINDLGALGGTRRMWKTDVVTTYRYRLHIPEYMGALIGDLVRFTEVRWCTTWRERANEAIARHLDIGKLPVITDGSHSQYVDWKAAAARPLVEEALSAGRDVFWIEDFYEDPPVDELPSGVVFVDTTLKEPRGVLAASDIPSELRHHLQCFPLSSMPVTERSSTDGSSWA